MSRIAFLTAVLLGLFSGFYIHLPLGIWIGLTLLFAAAAFFTERKASFFLLDHSSAVMSRRFLILFLFFAGCLRSTVANFPPPSTSIYYWNDKGKVSFVGRIDSPSENRNGRVYLTIRLESDSAYPDLPSSGKIKLILNDDGTSYDYGKRFLVTTSPLTPSDSNYFSYQNYLRQNGISSIAYFSDMQPISGFSGSKIRSFVYRIRNHLLEKVYSIYSKPESSLMAGILLGDESKITSKIEKAFQRTGTALIYTLFHSVLNVHAVRFFA